MNRPIRNLLIASAILIGLLVLAAFIFNSRSSVPAQPPLPNPNGYDDFVTAAKMLRGDFSTNSDWSEQELKDALRKNSEALALARKGLTQECRVPLPEPKNGADTVLLQDLACIKQVSRAFAAEGRLAEIENRRADAADSYAVAVRLGMLSSRGGLMIHSLVGVAVQTIGEMPLEKLVPSLDASQCRQLAVAIQAADADEESVDAVLERDRLYANRTYGPLKVALTHLIMFKSYRQSEQKFTNRYNAAQIRTRLLILELAARAYELDKGQRPKHAADLVPTYLKSLPLDPVTHTNMAWP